MRQYGYKKTVVRFIACGNTLSAALHDAWDGTSIRPAVKTCRVWASDPHIGIIGDVTPSELRELMHARELTNGFANRFIFFWAEGDKVPQYTPKDVVAALANRVAQVLRFAGADRHVDMDVMRIDWVKAANDAARHAPDPPGNPLDWKELAAAYHAHHFNCPTCIAAGRGSRYGLRCGTGARLWGHTAVRLWGLRLWGQVLQSNIQGSRENTMLECKT